MITAEKLLQLPNGEFISYDEIFSHFNVYEIIGEYQVYVLQLLEQGSKRDGWSKLKDKMLIGNESGVRIYDANSSAEFPELIFSSEKYQKIDAHRISQPIQDAICADLLQMIK